MNEAGLFTRFQVMDDGPTMAKFALKAAGAAEAK